MSIGVLPICASCRFLDDHGLTCKAFPGGIPDAITENMVDHRKPVDGDHGIQFALADGAPPPDFADLFPTAASKSLTQIIADAEELLKRGYARDAHGRFARTGGGGGTSASGGGGSGGGSRTPVPSKRKSPAAAIEAHIGRLVKQRMDLARKVEPAITSRVTGLAEKHGVEMYGIEHRLKTNANRVHEKIRQDYFGAKRKGESMTLAQAAAKQNDLVRFTFHTGDERGHAYARKSQAIADELHMSRTKNFWANPSKVGGYKGFQGFATHSSGLHYEVQFHTKKSFTAKMRAHDLFDKHRSTKSERVKRQTDEQMHALFDPLVTPAGAVHLH